MGGQPLSQAMRLREPRLPGCAGNPPSGTAPRPWRRPRPALSHDCTAAPSPAPADGWGCAQEVIFSPSGAVFIVDETIQSLLRYVQNTVEIQGHAAWREEWLPSEQGAAKPCTVLLPRFKWLETFGKRGPHLETGSRRRSWASSPPEGRRRGR